VERRILTPRLKRFAILTAVVWVAIACGVIIWSDRGPYYHGKWLKDWAELYGQTGPSDLAHKKAEEAIRHAGAKAVPYLVKWLSETRSDEIDEWLVYILMSADPTLSRFEPEGSVMALSALGETGHMAIPELTRLLNTPKFSRAAGRAARALAEFGVVGLPPLAAALTNENFETALRAAFNIRYCGTNARPVVPLLINTLRNKDTRMASFAAGTLSRLKLEPETVVLALLDLLRDPDFPHRDLAIVWLGSFGAAARVAVPELTKALQDESRYVRKAATNALRRIAPEVLPTQAIESRPPHDRQ